MSIEERGTGLEEAHQCRWRGFTDHFMNLKENEEMNAMKAMKRSRD